MRSISAKSESKVTYFLYPIFVQFALTINTPVMPENGWAAGDDGESDQALETFMRQRGKDFMDADGIAFNKEDLLEFWGMYQTMREEELIPPPDGEFLQEFSGH